MTEKTKTTFTQNQLRALIKHIKHLEEKKKSISSDIKEVYAEAKSNGFDTKALRKVVALRKKDANEQQKKKTILDMYLAALGIPKSNTTT